MAKFYKNQKLPKAKTAPTYAKLKIAGKSRNRGTFGPASECKVYTKEEREFYLRDLGLI